MKTFFFDNSFLSTYAGCPRQAKYAHFDKRVPIRGTAPLIFGGNLHEGLEVAYRLGHGLGNEVLDALIDSSVEAQLASAFAKTPQVEGDYRTLDLASKIMHKYLDLTRVEDFSVVTNNGKPIIEYPFAVKFGTFPTANGLVRGVYTGKIDMVVSRGGIFTFDNKSTSMLGEQFFLSEAASAQHVGYGWSLERALGIKPVGFCINALAVRRPTKKNADGEDVPKKRAEVEAKDFQRQWFYYAEGEIDEWYTNTKAIVEELLWNLDRGIMPQKKLWCVAKYGLCDYYDVCKLPCDQRDLYLSSELFKDNTWSPLTKKPSQPQPTTLDATTILHA